jgi:alcohol dehydrogenase YqhD (iron-dependent ADH family)
MEKFSLYNPVKLVFGAGELKQTGIEAKALGKKALVVSYKDHTFMQKTLHTVVTLCRENGVATVPFYEAVANPTMTEIEAGVALAKKEGVDMVIGVGGGSAMDTAKLIAAGVNYEGALWSMIYSRHDHFVTVPPTSALPILMIPTLPATSSEMNCGAVATNPETHEKSYLFHPCIYPKTSILDPELTCSLPAYQTACGAADAISHVIEVYLNGVDDTPLQDRLMEGIVITIMEHVKKALKDPNDVAVRGHLMWESCVAWNGWTLPGTATTTPMHMVAHPLSARFNVTHGATLAIIMPAWMKFTCQQHLKRYVQFGERIFGMNTHGKDPAAVAKDVIAKFEAFLTEIGVQTRMSQCGIKADDIETLLEDSVRVYFNAEGKLGARVPLTKDEVREVLKLAL